MRGDEIARSSSLPILACTLLPGPARAAATATLLLLHTNDVHDRVRSGDGGLGGLPFAAGYVQQRVAGRPDARWCSMPGTWWRRATWWRC
jgi:2',3'-cyclic-nucleotide 2'-phosphodiesterase (5'-nucleotidase family)